MKTSLPVRVSRFSQINLTVFENVGWKEKWLGYVWQGKGFISPPKGPILTWREKRKREKKKNRKNRKNLDSLREIKVWQGKGFISPTKGPILTFLQSRLLLCRIHHQPNTNFSAILTTNSFKFFRKYQSEKWHCFVWMLLLLLMKMLLQGGIKRKN